MRGTYCVLLCLESFCLSVVLFFQFLTSLRGIGGLLSLIWALLYDCLRSSRREGDEITISMNEVRNDWSGNWDVSSTCFLCMKYRHGATEWEWD